MSGDNGGQADGGHFRGRTRVMEPMTLPGSNQAVRDLCALSTTGRGVTDDCA